MSRSTAAIYPYDADACTIVRHGGLLPYQITATIAPEGFGYCGQNAGTLDGGCDAGHVVLNDFEKGVRDVDWVLFNNASDSMSEKILKALEYKKNVALLWRLGEEKRREVEERCKEANVQFRDFSQPSSSAVKVQQNDELYEMDVPVVCVCGMSDTTLKFEIQAALRESLCKMGYKVSQIGSREYASLFSMNNFPQYMFKAKGEYSKILYFNHLIKEIEVAEKPDVLIVGIPGGIIPFDKSFNNEFAWLAYLISNSVTPDVTIFSLSYNSYSENFGEEMQRYCTYRYGFENLFFVLSNVYQEIGDRNLKGKKYIRIDSQALHQTIEQNGFSTFDILSPESAEKLAVSVVEELSSNLS